MSRTVVFQLGIMFSVFILNFVVLAEGYRILYVSSVPSPSHQKLSEGYLRPLLKRGHKVTYITPFPYKDEHRNLTQININFILSTIDSGYLNVARMIGHTKHDDLPDWMQLMDAATLAMLRHDSIKSFLSDRTISFDLVIVDWLHLEILMGFGQIYQCPVVLNCAFDANPGILRLVDEVPNPAYSDHIMSTYPQPFSFVNRLQSFWELLSILYHEEIRRSKLTKAYNEVFGEAAAARGIVLSSYEDMRHNASLVVLNSHPSYASSIKLPQNVKSLAGYYIVDPPPPLPNDLQTIMDNAKDGVIYFSLGTNTKSKDLPVEIRNGLLESFAELKQTVIWKFEENITNLPKNVFTREWMPQSSILAHPNVKVFITHGGMLSTTESIHYGVPVIGIPCFGDQIPNIKRAARNGNAIKIDLTHNLVRDLKNALAEILTRPRYSERARQVSELYHARLQPAAQELVFWLEHAVRTRGAPHLRSPALQLRWHQRLYLDLLALLLLTTLLLRYMLTHLLKKNKIKFKNH